MELKSMLENEGIKLNITQDMQLQTFQIRTEFIQIFLLTIFMFCVYLWYMWY